jgi:hypothetical protein
MMPLSAEQQDSIHPPSEKGCSRKLGCRFWPFSETEEAAVPKALVCKTGCSETLLSANHHGFFCFVTNLSSNPSRSGAPGCIGSSSGHKPLENRLTNRLQWFAVQLNHNIVCHTSPGAGGLLGKKHASTVCGSITVQTAVGNSRQAAPSGTILVSVEGQSVEGAKRRRIEA